MPKRDIVRDGRIQAPKKRTDRSYLRAAAPSAAPSAPPITADADEMDELAETDAALEAEITEANAPVVTDTTASQRAAAAIATRQVGAARAIQQQGVRKRRELDVAALAQRDTTYAMHELRRIAIFASLVFITLVILAFVLN